MSRSRDRSALERALEAAQQRLAAAGERLRGKHVGGEWEEYDRAHEELLGAERALAAARGQEHAVFCDGFPPWDTGAPLPHLLTGTRGVALVYHVREHDPAWDGTYGRVVSPADETLSPIAIVRFERVASVRLGAPNDEVINGHPLFGKGLAAYRAHEVIGSRWLSELQAINSVHSMYDAASWTRYHHYLLAFHDETFDCVCASFTVEVRRTTLASACRAALEEMLGTGSRPH